MQANRRRLKPLLTAAGAVLISVGATACATGMQTTGTTNAEAHASMAAVHVAEIEEARLATTRSTHTEVRAFAQHMITDHRPLLERQQQLAARLGLHTQVALQGAGIGVDVGANAGIDANARATMMAFPTSRALVESHVEAMANLGDESGAEFDREYMDRQIAAHTRALQLATQFETTVTNAELRAQVAAERAAIAAHLEHAQQLRARL